MAKKKQAIVVVQDAQAGPVKKKLISQQPEDMPFFYSNHAAVTITPWDFCFRFSRIRVGDEASLQVTDLAHVYMSPLHAKAFSDLIQRQVKFYEGKFGQLPDPAAVATVQDRKD